MSHTEIRTALTEVRDAVEAPPVDRVAFQARVRAERHRRTTARAGLTLVGAAAATVAAVGLAAVLRDTAPPSTVPAAQPLADPTHLVGFVVQGKLVVGGPEGFDETDVPARSVLGDLTDTIVLTDGDGALVGVTVDDAGRAGAPERLVPGVVDHAWLDSSGVLRAQRADGTLVQATLGDGWESDVSPTGDLYLVDGRARVESDADGLTLLRDREAVRTLPVGRGVTDGSLVAGVLALETQRGVRFYDAATGRRTASVPGAEGAGELSPDGSRYARMADGTLVLVDPETGVAEPVEGPSGYDGSAAWTSDETFVVVARGDDGSSLWECDAAARSCAELYADPSGTLQLHS